MALQTGTCPLCEKVAEIHYSHIVPRWSYRRAIKTGGLNAKLVSIENGTAIFGGEQCAEYMLCKPCEDWIKRWEDCVANLALQPDDTFPALTQAKPIPGMSVGTWRVADVSALDTASICRFAISVVWRAAVSRERFPKTSLGSYLEPLRVFLLDDTMPVPAFVRVIVRLIEPQPGGPRVDQMVAIPESNRDGTCHVHQFAMFGMFFQVRIGGSFAEHFDRVCMGKAPVAIVTDGLRIAELVADSLSRAKAKGALAKRGM